MKLEIKHLAAYLPYGLKITDPRDSQIFEMVFDCRWEQGFINPHTVIGLNSEGLHKPILRPLSSLTKPITHKGDTFVPMQRLLDMIDGPEADTFSQEGNYYILTAKYDKWAFGYKHGFGFYFNSNGSYWDKDHDMPQLKLFNTLHEWMIDTENLIGDNLAIDVTTLTENPYAK